MSANWVTGGMNYFRRVTLAVGLTWLTVAFQLVSMRALSRLDTELVITMLVVSLASSLVAGLVCATVIRHRPLLMVVTSQLVGIALIAIVARS